MMKKVTPFIFLLVTTGCQTTVANYYDRAIARAQSASNEAPLSIQRIRQLSIGMTQWEVIQKLGGKSIRIATRVTAEGKTEVWTYTLTQIQLFQQGSTSSFMLGFGERINRDTETYIHLTFLNDKLVAMEGV